MVSTFKLDYIVLSTFVSFILIFVIIGFLAIFAVAICSIVFTIMGAIKANNGEYINTL